jgi:acyl carrier protein
MTPADRVRDFILNDLRWEGSADVLTDDFPLLEAGVIDSLGLFRLVQFLEEEYGIEIHDEELVPENFATLGAIRHLTERVS